jgi:hypothetical protein
MRLAIKRLFRKLTPTEVAGSSLADAEMGRFEALAAMEHAQALVGLYETRIKRLRAFLQARTGEAK